MSNKTYDVLVYIAQIALPAVGALYTALAGLWGFPHPVEIVGTISAVDVFMGVLLKIKSIKYNSAQTAETPATEPVSEPQSTTDTKAK